MLLLHYLFACALIANIFYRSTFQGTVFLMRLVADVQANDYA